MSPVTAGATRSQQTPAGGSGGFPRLLPPAGPSGNLPAHLALHGPVPYRGSARALIPEVRSAGLTGRGGAAFPVHRKLEAVAAARPGRAIVVGNAAEGEPASHKDEALLFLAPHLVLDGLQLAAEAVGAGRAVLYVRGDLRARTRLDDYLPERDASGLDRIPVEIVVVAAALPGRGGVRARQPDQRRARGAAVHARRGYLNTAWTAGPTLVQNVETLAHLALIARYGPGWFRALGTPDEPGTMLCTLRQASGSVDVAEAAIGTPLATLLDLSGAGAVLVGGYHAACAPGCAGGPADAERRAAPGGRVHRGRCARGAARRPVRPDRVGPGGPGGTWRSSPPGSAGRAAGTACPRSPPPWPSWPMKGAWRGAGRWVGVGARTPGCWPT